jgi:para-nitrobenzyl esterase
MSGINVRKRNTPQFWPYVDGAVVSENPATRGVQVPTIFGFSMYIYLSSK